MAKGAVLIGCGFTPTQADMEYAIKSGHIKNSEKVSLAQGKAQVSNDEAFAVYVHLARTQGWDFPGDLESFQLVTRDGRKMWSVYPSNNAPASVSTTDLDAIAKSAISTFEKENKHKSNKKWWQFWKK